MSADSVDLFKFIASLALLLGGFVLLAGKPTSPESASLTELKTTQHKGVMQLLRGC